jgi:integrase
MKRNLAERNVVELCDVPRGRDGRRAKPLRLDQARGVLTQTRDDPLHCYIVLSLLTGARTEELRALRWGVRGQGRPKAIASRRGAPFRAEGALETVKKACTPTPSRPVRLNLTIRGG